MKQLDKIKQLTDDLAHASATLDEFEKLLRSQTEIIDRVTQERDRLTRELSEACVEIERQAMACRVMQEHAAKVEHDLSKARVALEKAEGERDEWKRHYLEQEKLAGSFRTAAQLEASNARAAEFSCREHADAIVSIREKLAGLFAERPMSFDRWLEVCDHARQALSAPLPALASQREAERKAERAVVEAAREARRLRKDHAVIVLGFREGDKDEADRAATRAEGALACAVEAYETALPDSRSSGEDA